MTNISIILPMYNAENTIEKTIKSIINQTYEDWELIIVDDGSVDNCKKICDEYSNLDKRIKVYHTQNGGPSKARNYGIDKARGKYIMFIDSDDTYTKDMVKIMIGEIENQELDIVCCDYIKFENNKEKYTKSLEEKMIYNKKELYILIEYMQEKLLYNVVWNKIYKYDIIKSNNIIFNEEIDMGEDYSFNNVYFKYVNKAKLIRDKLCIHFIDKKSISSKYRKNEFERRINNISTNEELYRINNYPMEKIYKKYIEAIIGSIETNMSKKSGLTLKQQLQKIKYYIEFPEITRIIKEKENNKDIYSMLIVKKHFLILYFLVYFRTSIKKIMYAIKGKSYRR